MSDTERSSGRRETSCSSSRSGLKVGRDTVSEEAVLRGRTEGEERGSETGPLPPSPTPLPTPSISCLSGSLVLLRVLAFLWWMKAGLSGPDSIESMSFPLIPSLLELVGDVLFEKAESLRFRVIFRALVSVDGSEPAEGAGDIMSSDPPMAESLLE